jgi:hypothetical protein
VIGAQAPGDGIADQRSRTSLAWSRTALGSVAVALLVTRLAWLRGSATFWIVVPVVVGAVVAVTALARTRSLASARAAVPRGPTRLVAAAVVLLALVSVPLVALRWPS